MPVCRDTRVWLDLAAASGCQPLPEPLEVSGMLSLFGVVVDAAYHVVSAFVYVFVPVAGSLAAAAAIVAFTMTVRLLLLPLSYRAARGMASQARLAPQVQALQKRHARNPERLQREVTDLYQREGTGRFAGCLPTLLQLPFFSVMYQLFRSATIGGRPNGLLGHHLLGAALGSHWLSWPGPLSAQGAVFLGLFALLAIVAWVAARVARRAAPPVPSGSAGQAARAGAAGFVTRVLPYTTVAVAAFMPLAAEIYLLTTTAWTAGERAMFGRRIRHDETSTRGGQPCISRPSRTSPARIRRSPS
jgi:YidC/Oxa1 family membrane protein insertase